MMRSTCPDFVTLRDGSLVVGDLVAVGSPMCRLTTTMRAPAARAFLASAITCPDRSGLLPRADRRVDVHR